MYNINYTNKINRNYSVFKFKSFNCVFGVNIEIISGTK